MSQAIPSKLTWEHDGTPVKVTLVLDPQLASARGPRSVAFGLSVVCDGPQDFVLQFRLPWWLSGEPVVTVNGERQQVSASPSSLIRLRRKWEDETVHIALPKRLTSCPLPDAPAAVAFMDGPEVLAGLCDEEITLYGDTRHNFCECCVKIQASLELQPDDRSRTVRLSRKLVVVSAVVLLVLIGITSWVSATGGRDSRCSLLSQCSRALPQFATTTVFRILLPQRRLQP